MMRRQRPAGFSSRALAVGKEGLQSVVLVMAALLDSGRSRRIVAGDCRSDHEGREREHRSEECERGRRGPPGSEPAMEAAQEGDRRNEPDGSEEGAAGRSGEERGTGKRAHVVEDVRKEADKGAPDCEDATPCPTCERSSLEREARHVSSSSPGLAGPIPIIAGPPVDFSDSTVAEGAEDPVKSVCRSCEGV